LICPKPLSIAPSVRTMACDLATAAGTSLTISGPVGPGQATSYQTGVGQAVQKALRGIPVALYQAQWSDPMSVSGAGPAGTRLGGTGSVPLLQAAAFDDLRAHAGRRRNSRPS
jgi:hypothetical protein